jgi:hypothetical protein
MAPWPTADSLKLQPPWLNCPSFSVSLATDFQTSTIFDLHGRVALVSGGGSPWNGRQPLDRRRARHQRPRYILEARARKPIVKVADKGAIISYVRSVIALSAP